ncbi:MAG: phosphoribosylanthranilate isomerase, partial [Bacilli bacterium]
FVNANPADIIKLCKHQVIDYIQLHGHEDEDYIKLLQAQVNNTIIKVYSIKSSDDIKRHPTCLNLYDTYHALHYGGSNTSFNHHLLDHLNYPYMVAGGLNINNIDYLIKELKVDTIDVSSGVEVNGLKDEQLVQAIIKKVRCYNE